MKVAPLSVVTLEYTVTDEHGEVIDTTVGKEPLVYLHGTRYLVSGLEAELEGRSMALTLTDLGLRHGLCCRHGRFRPHPVADAELSLSASLADVLQLLAGQVDADTLFFQRRLAIAGDTELGLVVKNWLDAQERPAWLTRLAARWSPM